MQNGERIVEKRTLKRWYLIFYLRAFDQDTGELLGHVVDISTGGIMLISDAPIPIDKDFRLWLDVPQEDGERERLFFEVHSLWSKRDVNPSFCDTGFSILNASPEALLRIQLLIDDLRLSD